MWFPNVATSSDHLREETMLAKGFEASLSAPSPEKQDLNVGDAAEGFDMLAGKTWLNPGADPIRDYQRTILDTAMLHNTLVSLPFGLGKTFIAAVVIYNFYNWYPNGKIIFMAQSKKLVAEQTERCYKMGIPKEDTALITGAVLPKVRAPHWNDKHVFFGTPHAVYNDLSCCICPAMAVKCVVMDDVSYAKKHPYCLIVKLLQNCGAKFRVLALSGTLRNNAVIQKVKRSLNISRTEIRGKRGRDLTACIPESKVEIKAVSLGLILQIQEKYLRIMGEYCDIQASQELSGDVASLTTYQIAKLWNELKRRRSLSIETACPLSEDLTLLNALAHELKVLKNYSLRLFLTDIKGLMEGRKNLNGARLKKNDELQALLEEIRIILHPPPRDKKVAPSQPDFTSGHPKLDALREIVENHFISFTARAVRTRIAVYCGKREVAIEILQLLTSLRPLVKPVIFTAKSGGKSNLMKELRKGVYNTVVTTSDVQILNFKRIDLYICYNAKNDLIKLLQRKSCPRKKCNGRLIVLVTEGNEEEKFRSAFAVKENIDAVLSERDSVKESQLDESPSMKTEGVQTECVERNVVIAQSAASLQHDLPKTLLRKSPNCSNNAPSPIAATPFVPDEKLNEMLPEAMTDIREGIDYKNMDTTRYLERQEVSENKQDLRVQISLEGRHFAKPDKGLKRPLDGGNSTMSGNKSSEGKMSDSEDELDGRRASKVQKLEEKDEETKKKETTDSSRLVFLESHAVEKNEKCLNSGDGESTSLHEQDSTFIDDLHNETIVDNDIVIDIQARHLQAVKSPAVRTKAENIPYPLVVPLQTYSFSQAVDSSDCGSLMNDPLCADVEPDFEIIEEVDELGDPPEMSLVRRRDSCESDDDIQVIEIIFKEDFEDPKRSLFKVEEPCLKAVKKEHFVRRRDSSESDDDIQVIEIKFKEDLEAPKISLFKVEEPCLKAVKKEHLVRRRDSSESDAEIQVIGKKFKEDLEAPKISLFKVEEPCLKAVKKEHLVRRRDSSESDAEIQVIGKKFKEDFEAPKISLFKVEEPCLKAVKKEHLVRRRDSSESNAEIQVIGKKFKEDFEAPKISLFKVEEPCLKAVKKEHLVRRRDSSESDDDIQVIERKFNENKQ